jgi:RNA polymerase sigma-70 factor, ECF subfamily
VPEASPDLDALKHRQQVADLYAASRDGVYRSLIMTGIDAARAQEATQEAFLRLHVELREGRAVDNPRAWVYRAAHNVALDWIERQSRESGLTDAVAGAIASDRLSAEQNLIDREEMERVARAIGNLSARQRLVLELRAQGLQYQEIAKVLEVRPSTVGEFLRRAIRRLRKANLCDQET